MTPDARWIREFVVELRLRGVSGASIGDAVASVRELLRDSGQSAIEAFGPPRAYAARLDLPRTAGRSALAWAVATSMVGLLAFLGFVNASTAWFKGDESLAVSSAQLLVVAVICVLLLCLPLYLNALLRRPWLLVAVGLVGAATGVVMARTERLGSMFYGDPRMWVIATASVMVLLSIGQTIAVLRRIGVDPVQEPMASSESPSGRRRAVPVSVGIAWLFPIAAAVTLAATSLLVR